MRNFRFQLQFSKGSLWIGQMVRLLLILFWFLKNINWSSVKIYLIITCRSDSMFGLLRFLIFNLQDRTQFLLVLNPYRIKIFQAKSNHLANLCTCCEILGKTLVDLMYFSVKITFFSSVLKRISILRLCFIWQESPSSSGSVTSVCR